MSWLAKFYTALGTALVLGYIIFEVGGYSFADETIERIPADVRQGPGGYRSFHFWHSGYKGGK
jgi:hypothetical protein